MRCGYAVLQLNYLTARRDNSSTAAHDSVTAAQQHSNTATLGSLTFSHILCGPYNPIWQYFS
jgi:hypothetical protein